MRIWIKEYATTFQLPAGSKHGTLQIKQCKYYLEEKCQVAVVAVSISK
jgi:hypothetical protein